MTATTRARALGLTACAALCMTLGPAALARSEDASISYESETLQAYEGQLKGGQITAVAVNKRLRSLHVTLKSGQHVKVRYKAHEEAKRVAALEAKGIPVTVLTKAEAEKEAKAVPHHHTKRRTLAIVAVVVVVLLIAAGVGLMLARRRRRADEE
jgi:hypothetical protein